MKQEEIKMLEDYKEELEQKHVYSEEEINKLISSIKNDSYNALRKLFESQLKHAYEIASTYNNKGVSLLDYIHAANEGLEIGVESKEYTDYNTFIKKIDECIKSTIDLLLSYLVD